MVQTRSGLSQTAWPAALLLFLQSTMCAGQTDSVVTAVGSNGMMYARAQLHSSSGAQAAIEVSSGVGADTAASSQRVLRKEQPGQEEADATILQWDGWGTRENKLQTCSRGRCLFTSDRTQVTNASAVSWYFPKLDLQDMPPQRPQGQLWIARMDESPCAYELSRSPSMHSFFNIAVGMSDRAQVRICPHVREEIMSRLDAPPVPTQVKDDYRRNGTGLVAYIQSNCLKHRDGLVDALEAEGIQVDSYGPCKHNKDLPDAVKAWGKFNSPEFFEVERKYKFAISLENCNCRDYVTEKLFRRLHLGVVPIYEPGPDSDAWLPSPKSIVNVSSFESVRALAQELKRLDENASAYEEFLAWKQTDLKETLMGQSLQGCQKVTERCAVCDELFKTARRRRNRNDSRRSAGIWRMSDREVCRGRGGSGTRVQK